MASSQKKALRKEVQSRLSGLPPDTVVVQSLQAQGVIQNLPQYQDAARLSIYLAMPDHEAQTSKLVYDALAAGKHVFVPYLHKVDLGKGEGKNRMTKTMEMLQLKDRREYESLERDAWGIPTLGKEDLERRKNALGGQGVARGDGEDDEQAGLDLIVVPGVAFDETMGRLGHGAGFYDRFLTRYESHFKRKPYLVGLCLAEQFLGAGEGVPTDQWDYRMDAVAVGDGELRTLES